MADQDYHLFYAVTSALEICGGRGGELTRGLPMVVVLRYGKLTGISRSGSDICLFSSSNVGIIQDLRLLRSSNVD